MKYTSMLDHLAQIKETKPHLFRIKMAISAYNLNKYSESIIESALKNVEMLSKLYAEKDDKDDQDFQWRIE